MADALNPYAPPHAPIQDIALKKERPRRPLWVWVIAPSLGSMGAVLIVMLILGRLAFSPDLAAEYGRWSWFAVGVHFVFWCVVLTAAVFLFMLRVAAIRLFSLIVSIAALSDLSVFVLGTMSDFVATPSSVFVQVVVWAPILAYAYRLKAKGALR